MDRSNERIGEASPCSWKKRLTLARNDLPFVAQLVNHLEHLLPLHLGRVVTNVEQVFLQIDADLLNAWKP
jgi:hypothetical protein